MKRHTRITLLAGGWMLLTAGACFNYQIADGEICDVGGGGVIPPGCMLTLDEPLGDEWGIYGSALGDDNNDGLTRMHLWRASTPRLHWPRASPFFFAVAIRLRKAPLWKFPRAQRFTAVLIALKIGTIRALTAAS